MCSREAGVAERAAQVKGSHGALPQHLHLLRGAPHLVLEATPAQASPQLLLLPGLVGGQLLGPQTHKHTCTKHSHCCPRARSEPPVEQLALFQGRWRRQPPCSTLYPSEKSGARGASGPPTKNQLLSLLLPVWEEPPGPRTSPYPALERTGFPGGPFSRWFHLALSCFVFLHRVGKVLPLTSHFPSPQFC